MAGEKNPRKTSESASQTRAIETVFPSERPDNIAFSSDHIVLITGLAYPQLAHRIGEELTKLVGAKDPITVAETVTLFANGERKVKIPTNLRNRHVFIIQSTCPPQTEAAILENAFMGDAAKRASAREVTAIIPYAGYTRGDKKDEPRVSITGAVVTDIIGTRVDRIVTMDLHADQIQGFYNGPMDNLQALKAFAPILQKELPPDIVVVSPDAGGLKRAEEFAQKLNAASIASIYKRRDPRKRNHTVSLGLMGNVQDKDVLLVDDMIDTGGSLLDAVTMLKNNGARKIFVAATHGLFSANAIERLANAPIEAIYITDSVPQTEGVRSNPKFHVVDTVALWAKAIWCIETGASISKNLLE